MIPPPTADTAWGTGASSPCALVYDIRERTREKRRQEGQAKRASDQQYKGKVRAVVDHCRSWPSLPPCTEKHSEREGWGFAPAPGHERGYGPRDSLGVCCTSMRTPSLKCRRFLVGSSYTTDVDLFGWLLGSLLECPSKILLQSWKGNHHSCRHL